MAKAEEVLNYLEDIETLKAKLVKPMPLLVHCSAGIGRSGVLVLLELGLALLQQNETVDMPAILTQLRAQRMAMVQTKVRGRGGWGRGREVCVCLGSLSLLLASRRSTSLCTQSWPRCAGMRGRTLRLCRRVEGDGSF